MPAETNKAARILVPIVVLAIAAVVIVAVGVTSRSTPTASQPAPAEAASPGTNTPADVDTGAPPAAEPQPLPKPVIDQANDTGAEPVADEPATPSPGSSLSGLHPRPLPTTPALDPIGGLNPDGDSLLELRFTPTGAGVESITLARYFTTIERTEHYAVQKKRSFAAGSGPAVAVVSLAARAVIIGGQTVDLYSTTAGPIWRQTAPGAFEAVIEDDAGTEIARIEKRYVLKPDSYDIRLQQQLINLTDSPLTVEWIQYGPVDLPADRLGYGGDPRRIRFGYLLGPTADPSRQIIQTERALHRRSSIIKKPLDEFGRIWPTESAVSGGWEMVWAAMTNRYFAFVAHPTIDAALASGAPAIDKRLAIAEGRTDRVVVGANATGQEPAVVMQFRSGERTVNAGAALDLGFSAYTGPKWRKTLKADPVYTTLGMHRLVVFNFGGPCAFCTFQPLARGLLHFLGFFHDVLFRDWALAIMFLVVCVRGVLHPVTKRSQVSVQRFSKQMQALGPKQKKLQEKYKDDPKKLREEMARLMREEGVNFTGMLGCLPMFLQSPIWIALYAMLFFAFDLRHQPAFFSVFQAVSGGAWSFLGDLSAPDRFIALSGGVTVPLMGRITSINVLPILLGVVFFAHQKYLTPPPSATTSPEQQTQQKVIKVMMVVMFPVFMYNAPSGLSIYFITNSSLGIIESRYIRAHIDRMDLEPKAASGRKRVRNLRDAAAGRRGGPRETSFKQRKK